MAGAALAGLAMVGYLLQPSWGAVPSTAQPSVLPITIGDVLFNVPGSAIRKTVQRHSGPQQRIDLAFSYPSLEPARPAKESLQSDQQPLFLMIAQAGDTLSPEERLNTVYARYLDKESHTSIGDGLTVTGFRADSPYRGDDLVTASEATNFTLRCSRNTTTPGVCSREMRVDGADLTFRFPRAWLSDWKAVAAAMDRLTAGLRRAPAHQSATS